MTFEVQDGALSSMSTKCLQGWQRSGAGAAATWLFAVLQHFSNAKMDLDQASGTHQRIKVAGSFLNGCSPKGFDASTHHALLLSSASFSRDLQSRCST